MAQGLAQGRFVIGQAPGSVLSRCFDAPYGQGKGEGDGKNELEAAQDDVAHAPRIHRRQRDGHDDRPEGCPHSVAGVKALHQSGAEMGGGVGVEAGIDRAGAQAGRCAEQDHHPPGGDHGVTDQPHPGEGAAGRQQEADAHAGDQEAAQECGGQITGRRSHNQEPDRIEREGKTGADRGPCHPQNSVGHAQGDESGESEHNQPGPGMFFAVVFLDHASIRTG
ncbi:MAG: hypothetical protein BWY77_01531 [bacterium ADurb.Bin431]|nr:MAG: hypothetical protein BWY77_01531 [bacterium ADurb.Bin431]